MSCQNSDKCNSNSSTNQGSNQWIILILYILLAIVISSRISWY